MIYLYKKNTESKNKVEFKRKEPIKRPIKGSSNIKIILIK